jgi:hypothetical protein
MRQVLLAATVALMAAAGSVPAAGAQTDPPAGSPTAVTVEPSSGLTSGQTVEVTIDGSTEGMWIAQCEGDVAPGAPREAVVPGPRPTTETYTVYNVFQTSTGRYVTCSAAPGCSIGVTGQQGQGLITAPITMAPAPLHLITDARFTVSDGQQLTATVAGPRDVELSVALCARSVLTTRVVEGGPCGPSATVPAGSDAVERTIVAERTFVGQDDQEVHCVPSACVVAASSADGSVFVSASVVFEPYHDIVATPSRGLADGQEVAVRGVGLDPTYDGPPFWIFPTTGHWAFAQCDGRLSDQPSILEVFTHCAALPGGEVDVPTREADLGTVAVSSSVNAILGQSTDCTTGYGACVLALMRVTQFGTVESAATPLEFGA